MSLGAKVAQSPNISYVTYGGSKEVCVRVRIRVLQFLKRKLRTYLCISSKTVFNEKTKCPKSLQQCFSSLSGWDDAV